MQSTTSTRPPGQAVWRLGRIAGICLIVACAAIEIRGQSTTPGRKKTVTGAVKQVTTDVSSGDVNGMILDDGTIVRWLPHQTKRFTTGIAKGDKVEVTGRITTTPRNVTVLQAEKVISLKSKDPRPTKDDSTAGDRPATKSKTVTGTVKRFITENEAVNGMVLNDGTVVRWPAEMGKRFTDLLTTGNRVLVRGRPVATPEKNLVLEAESVTNERTNATVTVARAESPPKLVRPNAQKPKTVSSTVKRFTTAPSGQTDGMILDNGTEVRWPVALEKRFTAILARGNRVEVIGREEALESGKIVLHADTIHNLTTRMRAVADRAVPPPLPPPPPVPVRMDALEKRVRTLEDRIDRLTRAIEALQRQK
jgi:hypothetical protein